MKDNELRQMFASLESKVAASTSAPHAFPEVNDRLFDIRQQLDRIEKAQGGGGDPTTELTEHAEANRDALQHAENERLVARLDGIRTHLETFELPLGRINEMLTVANNTAVDRRTEMRQRFDRIEKAIKDQVPARLELPSPRIPFTAGMAIGALLFAFGVLAGVFLR